ncbi:hypothetical protein CHS0354_030953 [Potamilus streckersoni]|uniref:Uncharacterized protein n=1 Tax=Potamilus streckersoni TaxID=2493646 RepID=A0AAE0VLH3_9BIVA|nr:hypothetical protein CHS0354_030953 [Potamilus streckersoni]
MEETPPFLWTQKTNESTYVSFNISFDTTTSLDERLPISHSDDPRHKPDEETTYRRFKSVDDDLDNIFSSGYENVSTRVNLESRMSSIDNNGVNSGDGRISSTFDNMSTKDENVSTLRIESVQNGEHDNILAGSDRFYRGKSPSVIESHNVTLTWRGVNVYVKPQSRSCLRGPDPSIQPKQVLHDGELYKYYTMKFYRKNP